MDQALFTGTFQYPLDLQNHIHPPLLIFNLVEIKVCIDPILFDWLLYNPQTLNLSSDFVWPPEALRKTQLSEASSSLQETPRKVHESIHSSSDRETTPQAVKIPTEPQTPERTLHETLLDWYPVWTSLVLFGNISQCTVYFPTHSLTAVGFQGIQEAVDMSLKRNSPPEIVVVKLPHCSIRSASQRKDLGQLANRLPVKLPETMWAPLKQSFPWSFSIWDLCCYTLQNDSKLNFLKPISGNATVGLSIKHCKDTKVGTDSDKISVLGICVHIDNTPIVISLSDTQLSSMANILAALYEVATLKSPIVPLKKTDAPNFTRSTTPNLFKESPTESLSEITPTNAEHLQIKDVDNTDEDDDDIKLTLWMQWTIARLTLKLYAHNQRTTEASKFTYLLPPTLKLVFDMEDIMSSLDLQKVYMKFKSKIVTATILHYQRDNLNKSWEPGEYLGLVMRAQEGIPTTERQDECGFMSLTVTRAKCGHVHSKWGTGNKKNKLAEMKIDPRTTTNVTTTSDRYISEVVVTLQPIDLLVSFALLRNFCIIFNPVLTIIEENARNLQPRHNIATQTPPQCTAACTQPPTTINGSNGSNNNNMLASLDNSKLPLAYLECHGLRIVMPVSDINRKYVSHDICIFEIGNIQLTPVADNPICRTPIRPDIYQQAAQARILNVPGSEVEDRQYQLTINSLSINTGLWEEFNEILSKERSAVSCLHTMNENPALEWNNMGGKVKSLPHVSLFRIIKKFDLCFVVAPAILYKNFLVCGSSIEINFVSDIEITVSLCQIQLTAALLVELSNLCKPHIVNVPKRKRFSYIHKPKVILQEIPKEYFEECIKDSGVETGLDINSDNTLRTNDNNNKKIMMKLYQEKASERSSVKYSTNTNVFNYPMEILVAGGLISFTLYKIKNINSRKKHTHKCKRNKHEKNHDMGYEASEEGSIDETNTEQEMQPLLFVLIAQPNMFYSRVTLGNKINISCFDVSVKIRGPEYKPTSWIPNVTDFPINILETKPGHPDPDTGIPPSFLTFKLTESIGKNPTINIEFDRPIKLTYCLVHWNYLLQIKDRIMFSVNEAVNSLKVNQITTKPEANVTTNNNNNNKTNTTGCSCYYKLLRTQLGINNLNFRFEQIVLELKTDVGPEMVLSIGKINSALTVLTRPEKITETLSLENVTVITNQNGTKKMLLNPWSCKFDINLFWENWQCVKSDPQIQLCIESDSVIVDIGSEQLKTVQCVVKECMDLANYLNASKGPQGQENVNNKRTNSSLERDQHYKDDLRAGAFQFVEATGSHDELPLPYQLMFWSGDITAMAWRYPQPRVLTKVRVFPIPFRLSNDVSRNLLLKIFCCLEYWSECHGCYQIYTHFQLSDSEMCHLELPKDSARPAVSCVWRVTLYTVDKNEKCYEKIVISARAVAAGMRVDSYFNPLLVPKIQVALSLTSFCVNFYNQLKPGPFTMPEILTGYTPDGLLPEDQCFMWLIIEKSTLYLAKWAYNTAMFDLATSIRCDILDYSCLTQEPFILPFVLKVTMNLADNFNVNIVSKTIQMKFSPSIGHTLAVSSQIWNQTWNSSKSINDPPEMIIVTRYIVCNNTNYNLRFGQSNTEEDILLPSRFVHLYTWRSQKIKHMIKIGLEQSDWIWSEAMDIDTIRTDVLKMEQNLNLTVTIKEISATQKQIIISGQLIICNMLMEHFEMKLVPVICGRREIEFKKAQSHIIAGKSLAPSLVVNLEQNLSLRLRFYGLESAWSGDIPLEENNKCAQPWLVKVPLQERGQFLSIWCRIIDQTINDNKTVLVLLWPLFMVRSNLPVNAEVRIETPVLNVNIETVIRGKGVMQQLYCPGTIDHSHQLTFQLDTETPLSNPYVPLNYSLVNQKTFFKKPEKQNVEEILEILKTFDKLKWPYTQDSLSNVDWIAEDQPLTHVQVHYQNACEYSSSLLVELLPWCLMMNTLGCDIAIIANNGRELCRTRHNGIVTPPKLENTFQISVGIGETWNISPVLQLAKAEWNPGFYRPRINGIIPLEGRLTLPIRCENGVCMANITSNVVNEIQVLEIASSHILTNHTSLQLQIACIALPDDLAGSYNVPSDLYKYSFTLAPYLNTSQVGVPIIHWYTPYPIPDNCTEYTLHVMVTLDRRCSWSCPIRIDNLVRKSISIIGPMKNIPLVVIAQELKGQTYLSVHHDYHPQLLLENKCSAPIYCSQYGTIEKDIIKDNVLFNWMCKVPKDSEVYYTLPTIGEKFPDITTNGCENIVIAVAKDTDNLIWSQPVDINNHNEQYLRIPNYGDVKLIIKKIIYTILIQIVSITEIEISAGDIRGRLTIHEKQAKNMIENCLTKNKSEYSTLVAVLNYSKTPTPTPETSGSSYSSNNNVSMSIDEAGSSGGYYQDNLSLSESTWSELHPSYTSYQNKYSDKQFEWNYFTLLTFLEGFTLSLITDAEESGFEQCEIATLNCDNIVFTLKRNQGYNVSFLVSEVQFDNQLYFKNSYDFPVLLVGQNPSNRLKITNFNVPIKRLITQVKERAVITLDLHLDEWLDKITDTKIKEVNSVRIDIKPISMFIEDKYLVKLVENLQNFSPLNLVHWPRVQSTNNFNLNSTLSLVVLPESIIWESKVLAHPLTLRTLIIEPLSILLSVHSSLTLYIALDQSPLQFGRFEKKNLVTTHYRLGHVLTMHYLSGALFASGWVIGSLELLGSPGGLARSLGSGLRDFVSLPYYGFIQGPWAFIIGITHGSASLMRHVTAGTLHSVTKMASSVARNLDRLTMDEEHLTRTEESRRNRPQGLGQGLLQGLTGLGISLLGAVGGIAHHPLQSVMREGVTPRGLATGVGLGLVGVITKPLSGAAELLALTGQGLLQGAGWNPLPEPRGPPSSYHIYSNSNSILKYKWKFLYNLYSNCNLFAAIEGTLITKSCEYIAVALVLTNEALIIFNTDEDVAQRVVQLNEIDSVDINTDPTLVTFNLKPLKSTESSDSLIEMDPACRARVANFVKNSSLVHLPSRDTSPCRSDMDISSNGSASINNSCSPVKCTDIPQLTFYVNPKYKNYFYNMVALAKQQGQDNTFKLL